jgi:hypothetical protein
MPQRVRIELDRAGVREAALSSPEVRDAVSAIAQRIASEAQSKTDDEIVVNDAGQSRARSYVTRLGSGARGEAEDRALGSSIGG